MTHVHFPDHHGDFAEEEEEEGEPLTWALDHVELLTVGVDIGSSTSHLLFSRLSLAREAQSLSSRFVVVAREVLHRSPILLTPFASGLIQMPALQAFVDAAYEAAGIAPEEVDSGAVILTGMALEKRNSRAVAELFEGYCGRFVCATAGHNLEALLAAHGSGAVAEPGQRLHLDIGGGTSKFAAIRGGAVLKTWHLEVGARIERPVADMAAELLASAGPSGRISFSGGVAEYIYGREKRSFDDQGLQLAAAVREAFGGAGWELLAAGEGIRATVIGASQFTVQLSGNTVHLSSTRLLPLRNVPVADARSGDIGDALSRLDLADGDGPVALALTWRGDPRYSALRELGARIAAALPKTLAAGLPLVLAADADVGRSLGQLLVEEFAPDACIASLDGLELRELDYLDVGEVLRPAGVVPVVIKSLAFPSQVSHHDAMP